MGGSSPLILLFLSTLPLFLSVSSPIKSCPADQACFQITVCNGALANITQFTKGVEISCPSNETAQFLRLNFQPVRESSWKIIVSSTPLLNIAKLKFHIGEITFAYTNSTEGVPKFSISTEAGGKLSIVSTHLILLENEMRGVIYLESSTAEMSLSEQFMNGELKLFRLGVETYNLKEFWSRLQELILGLPGQATETSHELLPGFP
ncbi:hypothetical protein PFISCL1PPCAC_12009, partial [Pristionchus fissidentatus]